MLSTLLCASLVSFHSWFAFDVAEFEFWVVVSFFSSFFTFSSSFFSFIGCVVVFVSFLALFFEFERLSVLRRCWVFLMDLAFRISIENKCNRHVVQFGVWHWVDLCDFESNDCVFISAYYLNQNSLTHTNTLIQLWTRHRLVLSWRCNCIELLTANPLIM